MAVTANWYGRALEGQWGTTAARRVDWATDTIKTALTTVSYTPSQDADDFFNDVTNEITGTGYTAGGVTLGSKTVTYDTATNETRLDAADATWSTSTLTNVRIAVTYKDTGTASTSPLMGWADFGGSQSTSTADFVVVWDSTGLLKVTAS